MAHIERTVDISAERSVVWATLANLEGISAWNPNVSSASCDDAYGEIGATRTCHFTRGGHIDEVVSEWVEGERIQFAIGSHGGIRSADMGTELTQVGNTTVVRATIDYHVAFGPLGPVIDRVVMSRQMARMLDTALHGLKQYLESNHQLDPSTKDRTRKELS